MVTRGLLERRDELLTFKDLLEFRGQLKIGNVFQSFKGR
jgi:hypothetical protein